MHKRCTGRLARLLGRAAAAALLSGIGSWLPVHQPAAAQAPPAGARALDLCAPGQPAPAGAPGCIPGTLDNVLLPDLVPLPPTDFSISIYTIQGQRVLRLTTSFANLGRGRLELTGAPNAAGDKTTVIQHIYAGDAEAAQLEAGEFVFHPTHNHWHMEDFVRYELWTVDWRGNLQETAGLTDKVSFCLRDTRPAPGADGSGPAAYFYCGTRLQGISPGWADTYTYDLPGQYIDITGLPDGVYAVRLVVDPENYILEPEDGNNTVRVNLEIQGRQVRVLEDMAEYRALLGRLRPGRLIAGGQP